MTSTSGDVLTLFVRPGVAAAVLLILLALATGFGSLRMAFYEARLQQEKIRPHRDWFRFDLYRALSIANFGMAAAGLISVSDPQLLHEGQIGYAIGIAGQAGVLTFVYTRIAHVAWGRHPYGTRRKSG